MNSMKSHSLKLLAGALMLYSLSSCSFCDSPACEYGRPAVLYYKPEYVIDYNSCFEQIDLSDEDCMAGFQKAPLTDEMFNPCAPLDLNYTLARGDILEISILGEDDILVENALIAPDGKLYYTILDGIPAAGRSPQEVAQELQDKLSDLFISPLVSITPKESDSLNYYVLGRVKISGAYNLKGPVTLAEAIAQAGGLMAHQPEDHDFARRYLIPYWDLESSFIARGNEKLDVDFNKLLLQGDDNQNIYLRPHDYIYIAPSEKKDVFVLGSLITPKRLTYFPGMSLLSSIATIGGWVTPGPYSPDLSMVLVIRGYSNCPRVCCVDVGKVLCGEATDVYVQPGDIIYASHKPFRFGRQIVLLALGTFANAFTSSAGDYFPVTHWWDGVPETSDTD